MANKTAKVMAILALSGIIISVVGTGILFFMGSSDSGKQTISKEELQKMIDSSKIKVSDTKENNIK